MDTVDISKQDVLKLMVTDLQDKITKIGEQEKKFGEAITALQEICEHKFEFQGHDSHHDWEKCIYCGKTQKA